MFEFEMHGGINELKNMEYELCDHLGFGQPVEKTYEEWQTFYGETYVTELDADHERRMDKTFGPCMITDFPEMTSPFWNMSRNEDGTSKKIDVILGGMETIGSAERSTDKDQMRDTFHTISNGEYAGLIKSLFGDARVEDDLEKFLEFDFFPRSGGGIGMTRMINALDKK